MLRIIKPIVRRLATLGYVLLEVLGVPRMPPERRSQPPESPS